mgnify:CR=1 FL=1
MHVVVVRDDDAGGDVLRDGVAGRVDRLRPQRRVSVADRVPERISRLVYLDAFVPRDGESLRDIIPELSARMEETARAEGDGWRVPRLPPQPRKTPQPFGPFGDGVVLRGGAREAGCVGAPLPFMSRGDGLPLQARGLTPARAFPAAGLFGSLAAKSFVVTSKDIVDSDYNLRHCQGAERAVAVGDGEHVLGSGTGGDADDHVRRRHGALGTSPPLPDPQVRHPGGRPAGRAGASVVADNRVSGLHHRTDHVPLR